MNSAVYKSSIWKDCLKQFKDGVQKGLRFYADGNCLKYQNTPPQKVEYAVKSRYLHRGYYCPSPTFDYVIANARRGKILLRLTKNSKITHRYFFNKENKLYMTEYYTDGQCNGREYIVCENDIRYGFVFNEEGVLGGISVEVYKDDVLKSYMWSLCHNAAFCKDDWQADYVHYETYQYSEHRMVSFDLHFVALLEDEYKCETDALCLVNHEKYTAIYVQDQLTGIVKTAGNNSSSTEDGSVC